MLKLVYDLKAGFDDCYITPLNQEYDFAWMQESYCEGTSNPEPQRNIVNEAEFYEQYKDNTEGLLYMLEDCYELDNLRTASTREISRLYFSHRLGGLRSKEVVPIWEPYNWRFVYEPGVRSNLFYETAHTATEVMKLLNITRQQLHYYVKTGQIRKEFSKAEPKKFRYNDTDVQVLAIKLGKKYKRFC
jgi:hypothetical protein